jgi:DNA-binding transcriptional ArsR family regulator
MAQACSQLVGAGGSSSGKGLVAVPGVGSGVLAPADPVARSLLAKFFRALGDPSRLRLLELLSERERTGTDCVRELGLSQGRVSAHLACLVSCGLVTVRREGRFARYRVEDPRVVELVRLGRSVVADHAESVAACTRVGEA